MTRKKLAPVITAPVTTKTGDLGITGLATGERVPKYDGYISTLGSIDELNSWLGLTKAICKQDLALEWVQSWLMQICALIANKKGTKNTYNLPAKLKQLEEMEQELLRKTPISPKFVLPGSNVESAHLDIARTICRRAERELVLLIHTKKRKDLADCLRLINRLSDWLFILARSLT